MPGAYTTAFEIYTNQCKFQKQGQNLCYQGGNIEVRGRGAQYWGPQGLDILR